jgi:transposase
VLNHETRSAILRLAQEGHGTRFIAKAVGVARASVRTVLEQGQSEVPDIERTDQLGRHLEALRELHGVCGGNLVRVQEELAARYGVVVPYSTLTRFCRKAKLGVSPKVAAGRYDFGPGEEMQHDTSPHDVVVGGKKMRLQCASLVMCFSRRRFIQCYPRWTRFHVKAFLTRALGFLGGSSSRCMLDNSTVIMTGGTGADATAVPEMKAFADRFGFTFVAHRIGHANRSARVEGPFFHVENNFYPGRTFADLADLNTQAITWCAKYNAVFHKSFAGIPDELGTIERPALKPLPAFIPEPTEVHPRRVNAEGHVTLHTNRYSVPEALIDRQLEVHETLDNLRIFDGHRLVAEYTKRPDGAGVRVTLPEHRGRWRSQNTPAQPSQEERALRAVGPVFAALCDVLRTTRGVKPHKAIRRLHRIWLEYPNEVVESAITRAMEFGLVDLDRIERMILKNIRGDFFNLPTDEEDL